MLPIVLSTLAALVPLATQFQQDMEEALYEWRLTHGSDWNVVLDEAGSKVRMLFNGNATGSFQPLDDSQRIELAQEFLVEAWDMFGVGLDTLVNDHVKLVPLGMVGSADKRVVLFNQEVQGVPVQGGTVSVLFDAQDHLVCIDSEALPFASGFDVEAEVSPTTAADHAALMFSWEHEAPPVSVETPQLAIVVETAHGARRGVVVWEVVVEGPTSEGVEIFSYLIHAQGAPEVFEKISLASDAFQKGTTPPGQPVHTVKGNVTDGPGPPDGVPDTDTNNGFLLKPMPHVYVRDGNPNGNNEIIATTNADGKFTLPPSSCTSVELRFDGPYVDMCSTGGATCSTSACSNHSRLATMNPLVPTTLVVNPVPYNKLVLGQANVSWAVNHMRDWIRMVDCTDNTFDSGAPYDVRPNRLYTSSPMTDDCSCNAQYRGRFVWWTRGDPGDLPDECSNHVFHAIIWHEMGHWMNDRYNSGNRKGFGEGLADAWALYISDQPILGPVVYPSGTITRNGDNDKMFCERGDCPEAIGCSDCMECYASEYDDGLVLMGAFWMVREHLKTNLGPSLGRDVANALFLSWMQAYDVRRIVSVIRYQWLVLDDDDGILGNGTPNIDAINQGFDDKDFPSYQAPPVPNDCSTCFTTDFRTLDGQNKLRNGQDLSAYPPVYFTLTTSGSNAGPAIFDSTPGGPNAGGADPDLLVGLGNVLVLQDDPAQTVEHGIFDHPGDSELGGTLRFDFSFHVNVFSIDLIDIGAGHDVTVILTDAQNRRRTYTVPGGWTGDIATSGKPGFRTLQLDTLSDQPGFQETAKATAVQQSAFNVNDVIRLEVQFDSEGALDNLTFCKS